MLEPQKITRSTQAVPGPHLEPERHDPFDYKYKPSQFDAVIPGLIARREQYRKDVEKNPVPCANELLTLKNKAYELIASNRINELDACELARRDLVPFWTVINRAGLEGNAKMGHEEVETRYFKDEQLLPLLWCEPLLSYLSGKIGMDELLESDESDVLATASL